MLRLLRQLFRRRSSPAASALGGEVTVLVVTIVGFTDARDAPPADGLGDWHDAILPIIRAHGGRPATLDGDDVVCVFGVATPAVDAAHAVLPALARRRGARRSAAVGVGVATGWVFAGPVGIPGGGGVAAVTGGAVRTATELARRCGLARVGVLACAGTAAQVADRYAARPVALDHRGRGDDDHAHVVAFELVPRTTGDHG